MRLQSFITEADAPSGEAPKEKDGFPEKEEKTPEQEAAEQREKDKEKIVDGVKLATDKNKMNNMVKMAASLYKEYGKGWLEEVEAMMKVDVDPEYIERFMKYTENFAEKLTHLNDPKDAFPEKSPSTFDTDSDEPKPEPDVPVADPDEEEKDKEVEGEEVTNETCNKYLVRNRR